MILDFKELFKKETNYQKNLNLMELINRNKTPITICADYKKLKKGIIFQSMDQLFFTCKAREKKSGEKDLLLLPLENLILSEYKFNLKTGINSYKASINSNNTSSPSKECIQAIDTFWNKQLGNLEIQIENKQYPCFYLFDAGGYIPHLRLHLLNLVQSNNLISKY